MLTTVQPSRCPTSTIGSRSRALPGAGIVELANVVVVVHQDRQGGSVGRAGPVQHLLVAGRVAGGEHRPPPELGLDVGHLGGPVVGGPEQSARPGQGGPVRAVA